MIVSRQAVFRGLCATITCVVVLRVSWTFWSGLALPSISFHRKPSLRVQNVYCHGDTDCFPSKRDLSLFDKQNSTEFCRKYVSDPRHPPPRIATIKAQFGNAQRHYQRTLGAHALHNAVQGTDVHVLRTKNIDDLWNKPTFILGLLLIEMKKPEGERLQWILWIDRDMIILYNCRSPVCFLPFPIQPANETDTDPAEDIFRLETNAWKGLNNGVILTRVNRWSIDLFAAILAHRYYHPDADLPFTEQSAMGLLLDEPRFGDNVVWVPQHWFTAYPLGRDKEDFKPLKHAKDAWDYHARLGDFLVHFAGVGSRDQAMEPWLNISETAMSRWAIEA